MIYLLDVNALIAIGFIHHEFHARVTAWFEAEDFPPIATCSITELGFVRILSQAAAYGLSISQALSLLASLKERYRPRYSFLPDFNDSSHLPGWVNTSKQVTDGHLAALARTNGMVPATLDQRIPDAFLIPGL